MKPLRLDGSVSNRVLGTNTGVLAAAAWLAARDLTATELRWAVTITLDSGVSSIETLSARFILEVFAEEWGYAFRRGDAVSWIRVTDIPFVHGRDDFELLRRTPRLESISTLIRALEIEHAITLSRDNAVIASTVGGEDKIAAWTRTL